MNYSRRQKTSLFWLLVDPTDGMKKVDNSLLFDGGDDDADDAPPPAK